MVVFAILLLIIILLVLVSFKGNTSRKLQQLEQEIILLRKELGHPSISTVSTDTVVEKKPSAPIVKPELSIKYARQKSDVGKNIAYFLVMLLCRHPFTICSILRIVCIAVRVH